MVHTMCSLFKRRRKRHGESDFLTSLVVLKPLLSYVKASMSGPKCPKASKHFVLVHGAWHGAWSWYKIVALIRSSGHNVTALDLGASGINPKQVLEIPLLSDYFSPLMEFMDSLPAHVKVILVGHSFGGLAISKAMESFPEKISVAVFVTAHMPGPTLNATTLLTKLKSSSGMLSQLDNRVTYDNGPTNPPTTFILGPMYLARNTYQLCPIQDWVLATTLTRPLYIYSDEDISKEMGLSSKRYGTVRRVFIVAAEDKTLNKEIQEWMIEKNPPDEVEEISGSDHMAMMAIDLGGSGINPKQVLEVPRLSDYFSPLMDFLTSLHAHEKVVLVGHSLGGFAISRAMESFPQNILVAIFVTAVMPGPTLNATTIYSKDWALATMLVRPRYLYNLEDISKVMALSSNRYGSVRRVFIVAGEDKQLTKEFQQWMIERNPPDEVKEIPDADHMVMMSRSLQLFTLLLRIIHE
ncbi:methyl jasmonate esterase 1 [Capsicum annuum]